MPSVRRASRSQREARRRPRKERTWQEPCAQVRFAQPQCRPKPGPAPRAANRARSWLVPSPCRILRAEAQLFFAQPCNLIAAGHVLVEGHQRQSVNPAFESLRDFACDFSDDFAEIEDETQRVRGTKILYGAQANHRVERGRNRFLIHFAEQLAGERSQAFLDGMACRIAEWILLTAQKRKRLRGIRFESPLDPTLRNNLRDGPAYDHESLHAAGGLGQSREFAGALGRAGWKELVNLTQLVARLFANLADHGRDAKLKIVVADVVDHLPMAFSQRIDRFGLGKVRCHVFGPEIGLLEEAILVDIVLLAFHFKRRHLSPLNQFITMYPHGHDSAHFPQPLQSSSLIL